MLNNDQQLALKRVVSWWKGSASYMVLDGAGGVGKTFLVNQILKTLTHCNPILLTPTNEALKQLKDKIDNKDTYEFKTVHSALGIAPTIHEEELKFEHVQLPTLWDEVNLAIIDESSMIPEWILKILISIGIKILFIGHKSQLPPVKPNRSIFDKCISPVFEQGWTTVTLRTPMRNTGALWDFNNHLEGMIYTTDRIVPNTFDIRKAELSEYMNSSLGLDEVLNGDTKIVVWSNKAVDSNNDKLRELIFGKAEAKENKYLPTDKVILTSPYTEIPELDKITDTIVFRRMKKRAELMTFYSNSKAEVIQSQQCMVVLNKTLHIPCYKIFVKCEDMFATFYEPVYKEDYDRIGKYYEHIAWAAKSKKDKQQAFREKHFMLSLFAKIKHYYAATSHRLQGASIPKVIVMDSDISKNGNIIEQKKCRYVACSRAIHQLMFYRGL